MDGTGFLKTVNFGGFDKNFYTLMLRDENFITELFLPIVNRCKTGIM